MFVGFKSSSYSFAESDDLHFVDVIKIDDRITEQTYLMDIHAIDGSAMANLDYYFNGSSSFMITPDQQFIHVPVTLVNDSVVETTETFTLHLSNTQCPYSCPSFSTAGTITDIDISIPSGTF